MDRTWSVSEERVRGSRLHELIVELDFPLIYTTNYDSNLEVAFRQPRPEVFHRDHHLAAAHLSAQANKRARRRVARRRSR